MLWNRLQLTLQILCNGLTEFLYKDKKTPTNPPVCLSKESKDGPLIFSCLGDFNNLSEMDARDHFFPPWAEKNEVVDLMACLDEVAASVLVEVGKSKTRTGDQLDVRSSGFWREGGVGGQFYLLYLLLFH